MTERFLRKLWKQKSLLILYAILTAIFWGYYLNPAYAFVSMVGYILCVTVGFVEYADYKERIICILHAVVLLLATVLVNIDISYIIYEIITMLMLGRILYFLRMMQKIKK